MRWLGLFLLLFIKTATAALFNPESFTLANGMQVVVVNNPRAPVVTHMVWYKVGAIDEAEGQSGIAHLLEHLMFKGTENFGPGEFSRIIAKHGGRDNAFTSRDFTAYHQTIAVEQLELVMKMEAERMVGLKLDPKLVGAEIDVVMEERRSRIENDPASLLRERIDATLFVSHPYRRPVIGWANEIAAMQYDKIIEFYRQYYAPNNAVLVVAGDINAAKLKPLAEKHYGKIPANSSIARKNFEEPPQITARRVELSDLKVRQPSLGIHFVAPSYNWGDRKHIYPLQVLAQILGGGSNSVLYRRLVVEQGIAAGASVHYDSDMIGPSKFSFSLTPNPGQDMNKLETAVRQEISSILANGIKEEDLTRAKRTLKSDAIYTRDSAASAAHILGSAILVGIPIAEIEAWQEHIDSVTKPEIEAAARQVLRWEASVTGVLLSKGDK